MDLTASRVGDLTLAIATISPIESTNSWALRILFSSPQIAYQAIELQQRHKSRRVPSHGD